MRINEYPRAISFNDGDVLLKDGSDGTKAMPFSDAAASLLESVLAPTMHKNLYRGKYLGTSVTAAQKAAIQNGTFKDLYIGDYWTIGGKDWVIADMDYFYNIGSTALTKHHLVILPRTPLYLHVMNDDYTTTGGYINSKMRKSGLDSAKSTIRAAFGDMVLTHKDIFTNAVSNGKPSGGAWVDSDVELMNEIMVYGCPIFAPACDGSNIPYLYTTAKTQLSIFRLNMKFLSDMRSLIWLRDVVSAFSFACVADYGPANCGGAGDDGGVLPYFLIGS